MPAHNIQINRGDAVVCTEGGESVGSVREVHPHEIVAYIEGFGDIRLSGLQLAGAHDGKLVLAFKELRSEVQRALKHVHDRETFYQP